MPKHIDYVVETQLLSIGGSGAGITAAFYAAQAGTEVLLVCKGKAGFSGNAIMAGGGCTIDGESGYHELGIQTAEPAFTRDKMFDCMVKESFYLAEQNVLQQYVDDSAAVMKDYLAWGERAGSVFVNIKPCGWQASGTHFTKPLRQALKENPQINVMEDTAIVELLHRGGRVTGAVGIHIYTGQIVQINAKAVVIATGGYQPMSLKNTVTDMTGDGPAMAYRAGAALSDMEFMLSFQTALVPEDMRGSIYPFLIRKIPHHLIDKNGEEINVDETAKRLSDVSKLNKLINCYYMGHAVAEGRGGPHGGAFWDFSVATQEEKRKGLDQFYQQFSRWHKYGFYKGESMQRVDDMIMNNEPLEIGLGVEYSMGGIVVNENMETGIEGLYAAGEATTGTFGACRVGDGLVEMLCQGMKAGKVAAAYCKDHSGKEIASDDVQAEEIAADLLHYFDNQSGINAIELYRQMEQACDEGLNVVRCEERIRTALNRINELKAQADGVVLACRSRSYNLEWMRAIQARNMLICCEAAARAALERKESRGTHMRSDYTYVDHDHFLHHYDFKKVDGEMRMFTRKPTVTRMELPTGRKENVIQYFTDSELRYSRSVTPTE